VFFLNEIEGVTVWTHLFRAPDSLLKCDDWTSHFIGGFFLNIWPSRYVIYIRFGSLSSIFYLYRAPLGRGGHFKVRIFTLSSSNWHWYCIIPQSRRLILKFGQPTIPSVQHWVICAFSIICLSVFLIFQFLNCIRPGCFKQIRRYQIRFRENPVIPLRLPTSQRNLSDTFTLAFSDNCSTNVMFFSCVRIRLHVFASMISHPSVL